MSFRIENRGEILGLIMGVNIRIDNGGIRIDNTGRIDNAGRIDNTGRIDNASRIDNGGGIDNGVGLIWRLD